MGLFDDAWNTVQDVGRQIVKEVKKDAKDIVQAAGFLPFDVMANGLTNGGLRNLRNDAFRAMGVGEDDIKDMDYRNHNVVDNARALGNSLFNVGTTAVGAPGVKAALKGTVQGGKAAIKLATASGKTATAAAHTKDVIKAAVRPSNWKKEQALMKTKPAQIDIWSQPAKSHFVARPGTGAYERVYKGKGLYLDKKSGRMSVPVIRTTEPAQFRFKTRIKNAKAAEALSKAKPAAASAIRDFKQSAQYGLDAVRTFKNTPRSLILGLPHALNAEEVERKTGAGKKTVGFARRFF